MITHRHLAQLAGEAAPVVPHMWPLFEGLVEALEVEAVAAARTLQHLARVRTDVRSGRRGARGRLGSVRTRRLGAALGRVSTAPSTRNTLVI